MKDLFKEFIDFISKEGYKFEVNTTKGESFEDIFEDFFTESINSKTISDQLSIKANPIDYYNNDYSKKKAFVSSDNSSKSLIIINRYLAGDVA